MERTLFIEKIASYYNGDLEELDVKEMVKKIIDKDYPINKDDCEIKGLYNLIIGMEELSELQKEISKFIRGKGNSISILEEIADVTIILETIKYVCSINDKDVHAAIQVKLNRAQENLDNGNIY